MSNRQNAKVLVIHTGGTIAMKNEGDGAKPAETIDIKKLALDSNLAIESKSKKFETDSNLIAEFKTKKFNENPNESIESKTESKSKNLTLDSNLTAESKTKNPIADSGVVVESVEFSNVPSAYMSFEALWDLARLVDARLSDFSGVVITHGTDTMAESAYFLQLVLDGVLGTKHAGKCVVLTGAMKEQNHPKFDGFKNLKDAIKVAADSNIESKADGNTDSKIYPKTESNTDSKTIFKTDSNTASQTNSKADSKTYPKTESSTDSKAETKAISTKIDSKKYRGVCLLMAGKIFNPSFVDKTSATAFSAFSGGKIGEVTKLESIKWSKNKAHFYAIPFVLDPQKPPKAFPKIAVFTFFIGADLPQTNAEILIIEAAGAGNVSKSVESQIKAFLKNGTKVFVTSKIKNARAEPLYAYAGGAASLQKLGCALSYNAPKLRIFLAAESQI